MEPNNQNSYDFILSDRPKSHKLLALGGSTKMRVIQVVVGAVVLIIIFVVAFNLIFGSGKSKNTQLYQIAATQQDIIDLTKQGATNSHNVQIINQSATTSLVLTTQSNNLNSYLTKLGIKKLDKIVVPYRDTQYKKALSDALNAGKYDDSYQAIYANFIGSYRSKLQTAYNASGSKTLKYQLANDYSQTNAFIVSSN